MRPHFEIPLFLLPAFLLTSEIILISASTHPPEGIHANSKNPRSPDRKYNLTQCAKQCRAEFFQYCHTREPASKGDSNSFRRCMCVDRSGAQYMDHCVRRCNSGNGGPFPEQVGEMRAWWSSWCGKHEPTATTVSIPRPSGPDGLEEGDVDIETSKIPGMTLINTDGESEHEPITPSPSSKSERVPESDGEEKGHGVGVYAAGASVTFASAFLFLSYVMFMRRSKYARRRGILAWLRLRLLERGYRGGGAGLPRSRTTAMRMRVTNGRTAVVGNPKWLNKTMPPLPRSRGVNIGMSREIQSNRNDTAHTTPTPGFLSTFLGRQKPAAPVGLARGGVLGWNQERRKSHRYSQGWLNAAKKYSDEAEGEDEKVQDYFRSKGITRSGKQTGLSSTEHGNTSLQQISHKNESPKDVEEKRYSEGALNLGEEDEEAELVEGGSQQQQLESVNEDEEYIEGLIGSTSGTAHTRGYLQQDIDKENDDDDDDEDRNERTGRLKNNSTSTRRDIGSSDRSSSPDGDYSAIADISATPHLDGGQWDSWTGVDGTQINATGGLRRASKVPYDGSYGNGGLTFEEVELVEGDDVYGWTARSDVHSLQFPSSYPTTCTDASPSTHGSSAVYGPILPVIEPDPQHGKTSVEHMNQQQNSKARSKWRLSGKVTKGFLGRKGKRSGDSGSSDLGRGAYGSL